MRKLLALCATVLAASYVQAADTMDGCGLGWQVTSGETMMATTTRGTTNNFVPPSFGMTSGTIGCKQLPFAANEREAVNYVVNNFSSLKQQLAVGQGEYVDGLSEVMSCNSSAVRSQYNTVVSPAKNGVELYKNLKAVCG
ncbi:MAG: DUF3015 family protein [Pseudobdellovibrionaceae bacterium]